MVKEAIKRRVRERKQETLNPLMMAKDVVDVYVMGKAVKHKEVITATITKMMVKVKLDKTMIGLNTYQMID